jgi:hypothetical protein
MRRGSPDGMVPPAEIFPLTPHVPHDGIMPVGTEGDMPPPPQSGRQGVAGWLSALPAKLLDWLGGLGRKSLYWKLVRLAFAAVIVFGLLGVVDALPWWVGLLIVVLGVLAAIRAVVDLTGRALGATLAGTVVLVGVNVIVDFAFDRLGWHPPILAGLLAAVVVFGYAAFRYLRAAGSKPRDAKIAASILALVVIIGLPILVGLLKHETAQDVPKSQLVASKIDVLLITDGRAQTVPAPPESEPALSGFDVRYSVGVAEGDHVRWTLADNPDAARALDVASAGKRAPSVVGPKVRAGSDSVLVLNVDGAPLGVERPQDLPNVAGTPGEIVRWRQVVRAVAPGSMPTFALLQTTSQERLRRWQNFAPTGVAVSRQALAHKTTTGLGVALAISARTADADFALALKHRPVLLFDKREPVPRPLSVAWLFAHDRVRLCHDRRGLQSDCGSDPIRDPAQLESGGTHLELQLPSSRELRAFAEEDQLAASHQSAILTPDAVQRLRTQPAAPGAPPAAALQLSTAAAPSQSKERPDTTIYVHPVPVEREGRLLLYLDYWWYLSDNPSRVGGGALCGAGLVIPGITCDNHVSDWEGLTVVIDRTAVKPVVISVQYAQHATVVSYPWQQLRRNWEAPGVRALVAHVADVSERPLAFIAQGTHATYPRPCAKGCWQSANDSLQDGPHDGELPWIGNYTATCDDVSCVQMLPTLEGGRQPALWSAFAGTWGDVHCVLRYYCDSITPPTAPGRQTRYLHPTRCTGVVNARWEFHEEPCND